MTTLTDTAEAVLARRYYIGEEGWEELCERVATSVAMAEEDGAKQLKHSQEFFQVIYDLDFLPNSPCLMNAGTELGQLSACFVLPVPDTLDGIFTAIKHGALVNKTGGGTGYSFSRLRPKHSTVCSTNGVASGPISFAQVFDAATDVIKQGGRRRGANMGVLHCLSGKTMVHTTDGKMAISELEGKRPLVYCCDPRTNEIHIAMAERVFVSDMDREMVRVTLDNDTSIECTPDHRFLMSNGVYVEAQYLETGSSLMAFHKSIVRHGNSTRFVKTVGCTGGKITYEHRLIAKDVLGVEVNNDIHVHHIDGDALNNSLVNLEVVSRSDHAKRHDSNLEACRQKILSSRKGRTLEEAYGKEKADDWKSKMRAAKVRKKNGELANHKVVSVERIGVAEKVYDMTVPGWHNFVAEEVFVHNCTHPDIMEFIDCKRDKGMLNNFNLSVAVTDEFMERVATGRDYELVDPSTGDAVGALNAAEVFARIIDAAWDNGEPGILFIDAANRANPTPWLGQFEASNPCAEQFLLPYESCNLGSINLGRFIVYDEASGKYIIDWNRLNTVTRTAVRFLDNVVDVSRFPIPEITEMTRKTRKLGLGIMGLHDMLIKLELPYSSAEARTVAAKVMQYVRDTAESESVNLANEKGECPAFMMGGFGNFGNPTRRNAALTSIQPTGTVSMIADCSSGCEPYFALVNRKNVMDGDSFLMVSPLFEQVGKREGWYSNELVAEVARIGTVVGNERVPVKWQRIFACAQDIDVNSHIQMQAALQNAGVDASISKTINMPGTATKEDVRNAYLKGWALGCKGLTVYRDGCRDEQVLTIGERKGGKVEAVEAGATVGPPISYPGKMDLPDVLSAKRYRLEDKDGGTIYVIICFADGGYPVEVFTKFPADNRIEQQEQSTMWSAICRMVSLALRCGVPIGEIIKQLDRSSGHMRDLPAQLSKLFKGFMSATEQGYDAGDCPDCTGGKLVYQEGCMSCRSCGYSKCS